jgi:hypothetical protein
LLQAEVPTLYNQTSSSWRERRERGKIERNRYGNRQGDRE